MQKHIGCSSGPATYRYAHHMGGGEQLPAWAEAFDGRGNRVSVSGYEYPGLDEAALREKAIAILRSRSRVRSRQAA